ncbi:MAG: hypothetical protein KIG20_01565 [Eubacteriales bacterium]|nr:hypothetical protein [Eubacteriales bacterium]
MKNVTSDKYISFALSLLSSIAILVFKDDTTETGRIIIYCILGAVILGYLVYFAVHFFRRKRTLGSASIINNAKKYVKQMTALARANAKQLKKFDFLSSQKKLDKRNKSIVNKYLLKSKFNEKDLDAEYCAKKEKLEEDIRKHIRCRSENYSDMEALKAYNGLHSVMSDASLEKNIEISKNLIKRIFDVNRILLQIEQHNARIKLGEYVTYFSTDEVERIKGYMDLIGWSYVLLGDKKGYAAIFTAIDIIENRIGKELNKEAPKGMSQEEYEQYLFLKARAYRHLGSTYYTFKDIDVGHYCNEALKVLEVLKSNGFDKSKKSMYENMLYGVENNLYLYNLYKFISDNKRENGNGDTRKLDETRRNVEKAIEDLSALPKEEQDNHRMLKLLSLKCQINKVFSVIKKEKMDIDGTNADLKKIEATLAKNIYFDDAMEVYTNQKVQLLFEETKNILME